MLHSSAGRPYLVLDLIDYGIVAEPIWRLIHAEWNSFDAIPHKQFAIIFREHRSEWRPNFLSPKDRAFYDSLPARFQAYRGQDVSQPVGLSWTLDRDVAAAFARGHRGIFNPNPVILRSSISKRSVAGAYTGRNEREIVTFCPSRVFETQKG
jgi:hypothetical protein